jgi:divalent metal cation (Fe/Co/Zn/Cd) transporter
MVLRTGIHILRESSADLMDTVPGRELEEQARAHLGAVPGVIEVEEVHAHRFGPYLVLNIQIGIDGGMTVTQGDAIASEVEAVLKSRIGFVLRAYVHYHPARQGAARA